MQLERRVLPWPALRTLLVTGALVLPLVVPSLAFAGVPQSPKGFDRKAVVTRAHRWVSLRVPYSQTHWYGGYRQDCSGFVSMAWDIHASYPTGMMNQIAKPIPKSALKPGDVILNNTSSYAHVILFERWSGPGQRHYVGLEQLSSTNRPVRRTIPYPYFRHAERYRAYRFTGVPPKPKPRPKPKPAAAKPASTMLVPPRPSAAGEATRAIAQAERTFPFALFGFALTLAGAAGLGWGLSGRGMG